MVSVSFILVKSKLNHITLTYLIQSVIRSFKLVDLYSNVICVKESRFHLIHGSRDLLKSFDVIEFIGLIDGDHVLLIIFMLFCFLMAMIW